MTQGLHHLDFDGALLARGFWPYIWEIAVGDGRILYYVGKTGDKSSGASPFDRLSKHLGTNRNNNALHRHLEKLGLAPEQCHYAFRAYGPLLAHVAARPHSELCDVMSMLERSLPRP